MISTRMSSKPIDKVLDVYQARSIHPENDLIITADTYPHL